jgi:hypothetical protein
MHSSTRLVALSGLALLLTATVPAGVATATAAGTTPSCRTRDLAANLDTRGGGAAGSLYVRLVLRNDSGRACHTGGYPGVAYVGDGNGTQIGAAADRVDRAQVRTLQVPSGGRVAATVREVDALNYPSRVCRPRTTDGLRVYPPNQTTSTFVRQRTTGCRTRAVHLLTVTPLHRTG